MRAGVGRSLSQPTSRPLTWQPLADADPVPGDPATVRDLAGRYARAAEQVGEQAGAVRRVSAAAGWEGPAAEGFRARAGGLPVDLDRVAARCQRVARALGDFAPELEAAQYRARVALNRAHDAQLRAGASPDSPVGSMPVLLPGILSPADRRMHHEVGDAQRSLAAAVQQRDQAAARCARALQVAADDRLRDPHGWRRALQMASAVAGGVSTWLGVAAIALCWVPGLGQALGAVALTAGGVALLADLALTAYGDRGWPSLALDLVGVLPAGRAVRFGALLPREATQAGAVARAAAYLRPTAELREGVQDLAAATSARSWSELWHSPGGLLDEIARARQLRRGGTALIVSGHALDLAQSVAGVAAQPGRRSRP